MDSATPVSLFLALCWLVVFAVGIFRFRMRGLWLVIGLLGQALFASRFIIQWFKSEMEGRSVIPSNQNQRQERRTRVSAPHGLRLICGVGRGIVVVPVRAFFKKLGEFRAGLSGQLCGVTFCRLLMLRG